MRQKISSPDYRKYFTMIPNLYDDASDLDVWEFRLLVHYMRRGECYESVRTTAEVCNMTHPTVIKKRKSLESKGYIRTWTTEDSDTIHIAVVDMWETNREKYEGGKEATTVVKEATTSGSVVSLKNNPLRKTNNNIPSVDVNGRTLSNHHRMVWVLDTVCVESVEMNSGHMNKLAKALIDAGFSPEKVYDWYNRGGKWYSKTYKGKGGHQPRLYDIRQTVDQLSQEKDLSYEILLEEAGYV